MLPPGYIARAVEVLIRTGAANVGGRVNPIGTTPFERAVALATVTRLGAGDARYRVGGPPGPVDTVFPGTFRRAAVDAAGGFDEIIDDNVEDSRETVRLRLSNASGATITLNGQYGTIWNSEEERQAALNASVIGPLGLSVADARVQEAANATVDFTVTLSRAGTATVTVDYATSDGSSPNGATAGADYTAASGTLTFAPGETAKTISVPVIDDSHDEVQEIFTLTLSNASGDNAWLSDATATGTIENTDAMPQAWLARFGRTVAGHVLDTVSERMRAPRAAGLSATLGGQALPGIDFSGDPAARPAETETETETETREAGVRARALSDWLNGGTGDNGDGARGIGSRTVTGRELVLGSTFSLTGETSDGGTAGFWGRAAVSGFDGREGDLSLDGEVTTGLLGADYGRGRWLMGLIASHSRGEGSYRGSSAGTVSSALTGLHPWARYAVSERLSVWGAAGYGRRHADAGAGGREADEGGPVARDGGGGRARRSAGGAGRCRRPGAGAGGRCDVRAHGIGANDRPRGGLGGRDPATARARRLLALRP